MNRLHRHASLILLATATLTLGGCGYRSARPPQSEYRSSVERVSGSYQTSNGGSVNLVRLARSSPAEYKNALERMMNEQDFNGADALVAAAKDRQYGQKNSVLYWLDRGALLHDMGLYADSEAVLDQAARRMEELFTKSRSKSAARYFVNDATEDYRGEPYVQTLLHLYRAMNALYMRKSEDAAVEARLVARYLQDLEDNAGLKIAYKDDPFAHLVAALAFEEEGESDDARIEILKARKAYADLADTFQMPVPQRALQKISLRRLPSVDVPADEGAGTSASAALDWQSVGLARQTASAAGESPYLNSVDGSEGGAASTVADASSGTSDGSVEGNAATAFSDLEAEKGDVSVNGAVSSQVGDAGAAGVSVEAHAAEALADLEAETGGPGKSAPEDKGGDGSATGAASAAESAASAASESSAGVSSDAASQEKQVETVQKQMGELVFVHYVGRMPVLKEDRIQLAGNDAMVYVNEYPEERQGSRWTEAHVAALSRNSVVVALPRMEWQFYDIHGSVVECVDSACEPSETELVSNLANVAMTTFNEQLPKIKGRAIARAAIKVGLTNVAQNVTYAVGARQLGGQAGAILGAVAGVVGRSVSAATEKADTRNWLTAPAEIRMARVLLPPGVHRVRIRFTGENGADMGVYELPAITIRPGKRTYEHVRTAY